MKTYSDTVIEALKNSGKSNQIGAWKSKITGLSVQDARIVAKSMDVDPFWDWGTSYVFYLYSNFLTDAPRTREGFYRYHGGTGCCVAVKINIFS